MSQVGFGKAVISKKSGQPIQLLRSGQLLSLTTDCYAGLILQKPFYAEFVGPGAAVGSVFDMHCTSVYTLGSVEFWVPSNRTERQEAFQKRVTYIESLQKITLEQSPLRRAFLIVGQLCQWVGTKEASQVSHELIAQMVGVLPGTVAIAWQQYIEEPSAYENRLELMANQIV